MKRVSWLLDDGTVLGTAVYHEDGPVPLPHPDIPGDCELVIEDVPEPAPDVVVKNDKVKALRDMADFLEKNPDLLELSGNMTVNLWPKSEDYIATVLKLGLVTKHAAGDWFWVKKQFDLAGDVGIECNRERKDICQRVLKGTKVLPATPETIIPAKPEQVVEEYEWVCPESLLAKAKQADADV